MCPRTRPRSLSASLCLAALSALAPPPPAAAIPVSAIPPPAPAATSPLSPGTADILEQLGASPDWDAPASSGSGDDSARFLYKAGWYHFFDINQCRNWDNCYGNNPTSPYAVFHFDDDTDVLSHHWHLGDDEAVVLLARTPPRTRYFSVTPYLFSRQIESADDPNRLEDTVVYASLSDSLNHRTVNTSCDDDWMDGPFGCQMVVIVTADASLATSLSDSLAPFYGRSAINVLSLAPELLRMGYERDSDTFQVLVRYAMFLDPDAEEAYFADPGADVFKIKRGRRSRPQPFPYPSFRNRESPTNEDEHRAALDELEAAVRAAHFELPMQSYRAVDVLGTFGYENGYTCINLTVNCNGDNRDALYMYSPTFELSLDPDDFVVVIGVVHTLVGKSAYNNLSVLNVDKNLGLGGVTDIDMLGSAADYLVEGGSQLYAYRFARDCRGLAHCFNVPVTYPGVDLDQEMRVVERVYMDPATDTSPLVDSILAPRLFHFRGGAAVAAM